MAPAFFAFKKNSNLKGKGSAPSINTAPVVGPVSTYG